MLDGAATGQPAIVGHRGCIDRTVQHGNDNLEASLGDGPWPFEAGQARSQFMCNLIFGHGNAPATNRWVSNMLNSVIIV
jgi:hypothetical protein